MNLEISNMRHLSILNMTSLFIIVVALVTYKVEGATDYQLWYTSSATAWRSQCLPIGNGSIGGGTQCDIMFSKNKQVVRWRSSNV